MNCACAGCGETGLLTTTVLCLKKIYVVALCFCFKSFFFNCEMKHGSICMLPLAFSLFLHGYSICSPLRSLPLFSIGSIICFEGRGVN